MKRKRNKTKLYFRQAQRQETRFRTLMAICIVIPAVAVTIMMSSISKPQKTQAATAVYPDSTFIATVK
jgi:hypothetical protein